MEQHHPSGGDYNGGDNSGPDSSGHHYSGIFNGADY